ncbi:putative APC1-subunit of anaphase-promoting complex [Coleophoma cylindrospora]|uniref:Putative APC1-subunit of anaphase-promoting complex n=1 Tax=Coleophoma cylindrospora TaxID=1849047 RepID=A0A3D8SF97_9HELO|nr:putative APC1-subunit of anaphase-promoting complex [Coleophoma cylindrospora]
MASVTSLGLHQPTGLQYALQERLLPADPAKGSYVWHNDCDHVTTHTVEDDELLVTPRCVVWSRGGLFRKSYKFDLEKEEVSQALLTWFPNVKSFAGTALRGERNSAETSSRSKAIVVLLKTQAHIYFLSGTSHVIHLPFEVESAVAAPNGLIIQRKLRVDNLAAASLKFPRVPPNSFVSSQPQTFSATSSQQSTFSIADLGAPKQMPLPPVSTLKDMWDPPALTNDSNWPRLFSLTDPLSEMGLIVTQLSKQERRNHKANPKKLQHLDTAEEIIHVTKSHEFAHKDDDQPLILALTLNRETSMYTVWKLLYVGKDAGKKGKARAVSGTFSRRRSSFVPGTGTGATTPAMNAQHTFRESFGGEPNMLRSKQVSAHENELRDDLASTLDPDYESTNVPRRKSRRVSSMLARADLSASHERSAFNELTGTNAPNKRGESLGSQYTRGSIGTYGHAGGNLPGLSQSQQFSQSINSLLEAPVDDLLDELRAGGDFEGFHNMGLDDEEFDALKQEIILTKITSVPAEHSNVRYSSQHIPAKGQCKVFTMAAPPSAADDQQKNTIVICILDPDEKRLLVLTLYTKVHKKEHLDVSSHGSETKKAEKQVTVVSLGDVMRAKGVIDACRLDDGSVSRILVLTDTSDGFGELTLQAPWSALMKIPLPEKFAISGIHSLGHDSIPRASREGSFKRVLSQGPRALKGLRNSKPFGIVDLIDDDEKLHQLRILMQPRNPHVRRILEVGRAVLPGPIRGGEGILVCWWNVMQWLRLEDVETVDTEWSAAVITLFTLVLATDDAAKAGQPRLQTRQRKVRSGLLRSSSGAQSDHESWEIMQSQETFNGNPVPSWANNGGWSWIADQDEFDQTATIGNGQVFGVVPDDKGRFIQKHVRLTHDFMDSALGQAAVSGYLPTSDSGNRPVDARVAAVTDVVVALHLFREEQKLDTMAADALSIGVVSLTPVLAQICRWLNWKTWTEVYDVEDVCLADIEYDMRPMHVHIPEPYDCPTIYQWVQTCLLTKSLAPFLTLAELAASRSSASSKSIWDLEQWEDLTPRTLLFVKFFASMKANWSPVQFVEALSSAGISVDFLETLPEAILLPLREAIAQCRKEPPTTWNKELLTLVGREDVNTLLTPGHQPRQNNTTLLAPSHESNLDVHSICASIADVETTGSFDGSAEFDRQSITRAIFKDDRRMNEARNILNTIKPTVARVKTEPSWSESDILEAQKEHVQMLAYRTLAIPAGRGLLYFSARIPLLTQRFNISGFNLNCVMKPDNNTVGVDKNAFTEEKVCWAFFHAGVAAGLSISRDAKGIDTSWILYNKPIQELSNRHAGFLLALGLNGHLKSVAKWVAFKYLTPKHTMTSIGLLLGLAASYIGTMDSLITRLLSVHVTRMLPPGAAELNLSPLTQTTGIMGIGLLYCNTQHRRMSEIMVSEIEHIDTEVDEEPLRNEGYRLAAGFALGLINLGKGSDLKGLHDMGLTERLLALAAGSKKVDLVHVLDKATAAAVVAVALIFMKSEDKVLARKIDVPDSILQFDFVRPDIFLLRTLAKHLIMWSKIEPTLEWVERNLPQPYRERSKLDNVTKLTSEDLPFYDIVTGLCFAVALRYAGSGSIPARDLLIHYLDQLVRICQIPTDTFDKKLTRNTIRNCQDLLALAVSTVMAGTGDIVVFRRLRAMHGRDDGLETPYGSHLAAHLAIGALFLGGGTHTFGTSNLAIAALLIAFYPIFPSSVQDNKSHLQAFRHFWVLAAEPRCMVTRDIDTNQPVAVPIVITPRVGECIDRHTPCLLPELDQISNVQTKSSEHWNVVVDLQHNETHIASFKATQTIYIRRRPVHETNTSTFQATLQALNETHDTSPQSLEWLFELESFASLTQAERALVLPADNGGATDIRAGTDSTVVDARLVLERATLDSGKRDRLLGLKLLFEWADMARSEGREMQWIKREAIERLKGKVWMAQEQQ